MPRRRVLRQSPGSDFAFVNYKHPAEARNPETQQTVRRHVMRDIGVARRKRPRCTVIDLDIGSLLPPNIPQAVETSHASFTLDRTPCSVTYDSICAPPRSNPVGILGVDLTDRDLQLVHFMIAEREYNYRAFHAIWIRIGLSHSTCLYLTLARAAICQDRYLGRLGSDVEDSAEANRYYLTALRRLNMSLEDTTESTSPGVIATVLGCLCHDTHINDWNRWAIHIKGLKRLSDRRGGFDDLEEHIGLTAWWLDLVGCSVLDQRPRFAIPRGVGLAVNIRSSVQADIEKTVKQTFDALPELSPIGPITIGMVHLADIIRKSGSDPSFWQDAVGGISVIGPLTHQLLTVPKLSDHTRMVKLAPTLIVQELMRSIFLMLLSRLKKCLSLHASDMETLQDKMNLIGAPELESVSGTAKSLTIWVASTFASLQKTQMDNTEHPWLSFVIAMESLLTTLNITSYDGDYEKMVKWHPT